MNLKETALLLIAMNQTDARIQSNESADRDWFPSLSVLTVEEARAAWREFLRTSDGSTPTPGGIRRIGLGIRSRRRAHERAIEPPRRVVPDPRPDGRTWAELVELGRAERERDLKRAQGHL